MTSRRRLGVLLGWGAISIGVAGCTTTVSASDIAQQAKTRFNQQFAAEGSPKRLVSVSCPKDLQGRAGVSEVCPGTGNPGHVPLTIKATVTSVSGSTVHFHYNLTVAAATGGQGRSGTRTSK